MSAIDLSRLLPVVYRLRDAERHGPLVALLELIDEQAELIRDDIEGLWDDMFIETSRSWVIPYIGDLVANVPLHPVVRGPRADVARTIYYRRRKGVEPMLEELAGDVTGWGAHVVATFELLGWSQNLNHVRLQRAPESPFPGHIYPPAVDRVGPVNLRTLDAVNRIAGPFEWTTHTVDVRRMANGVGRYGIKKVAFFLWRLQAFPLVKATAHRVATADPLRYTFSSLGNPAPLFTAAEPVPKSTELAGELNVRGPIRPMAFYGEPDLWYGPGKSFSIAGVPVGDLICKDLGAWAAPPANKVAVDVSRGRIMFGTGKSPAADPVVDYRYGFSGELGGGPYKRERRRETPAGEPPLPLPRGQVDPVGDPDGWSDAAPLLVAKSGAPFTSLSAALTAWITAPVSAAGRVIIQIEDSATYVLPAGLTIPATTAGRELRIQAKNGERPTLVGDVAVAGTQLSHLTLDGLLISGQLALQGELVDLEIRHCTLVPGNTLGVDGDPLQPTTASLLGTTTTGRQAITIERSILGPIRLPADQHELAISDSIVDAPAGGANRIAIAAPGGGNNPGPGPETSIVGSTVFGRVNVRALTLGSDSIFFAGPLLCERRQVGCLRFSYLDTESSTAPRRYRCQPDLAIQNAPPADKALVELRVQPWFTSVRYGEPGYAQLARSGPCEIATGAEDGSEMGAFSFLRQPQREANLRLRLDEYLPFGLEPGLVHVT